MKITMNRTSTAIRVSAIVTILGVFLTISSLAIAFHLSQNNEALHKVSKTTNRNNFNKTVNENNSGKTVQQYQINDTLICNYNVWQTEKSCVQFRAKQFLKIFKCNSNDIQIRQYYNALQYWSLILTPEDMDFICLD